MHQLRQNITQGRSSAAESPLTTKAPAERKANGNLARVTVRRCEARQVHQRNEDRYVSSELSAYAIWRNLSTRAKVLNLSSNGLMIESRRHAHINETVSIRFADCNPVRCSVRWVRDGRIGLEFIEETEILAEAGLQDYLVDHISKALDGYSSACGRQVGKERRGRELRHGLVWIGSLTIGTHQVPVRLRNVSASGAMVALEEPCEDAAGQGAILDLGLAGSMNGTVKWAAGCEIGIEFARAFDLSRLASQPAAHIDLDEDEYQASTASDIGYFCREDASLGAHSPPQMEHRRLTLQEVYATLYPDRPSNPAASDATQSTFE